jgi:hypothetical protein
MLYDKVGSFVGGLTKFVIGLAMFLSMGLMRAFVVMHLWNWFVVVATNANHISLMLAWGLASIVGLFTWHLATNPKYEIVKKDPNMKTLLFQSIVMNFARECGVSGTALLIGYIIHSWM